MIIIYIINRLSRILRYQVSLPSQLYTRSFIISLNLLFDVRNSNPVDRYPHANQKYACRLNGTRKNVYTMSQSKYTSKARLDHTCARSISIIQWTPLIRLTLELAQSVPYNRMNLICGVRKKKLITYL